MSSLRRFTFGNNAVINFDVTANWAGNGVTDVPTFISFMQARGLLNIVVTAFNLVNNRLQLVYSASGNNLNLTSIGVTDYQKGLKGLNEPFGLDLRFNNLTVFDPIESLHVDFLSIRIAGNQIININTDKLNYLIRSIGFESNLLTSFTLNRSLPNLLEIGLGGNQLNTLGITAVQPNLTYLDLSGGSNTFSTFEYGNMFPKLEFLVFSNQLFSKFAPIIPLSNTINTIVFNGCRFTTQGYIDSEAWANSLTVRPGRGQINLQDNLNSAIGTNFKTILESKGFTVLAN